jgi:hypothetical protein
LLSCVNEWLKDKRANIIVIVGTRMYLSSLRFIFHLNHFTVYCFGNPFLAIVSITSQKRSSSWSVV